MNDEEISRLYAAAKDLDLTTVNGTGRETAAPLSALAQGITFGGADEAEAFVRSKVGGENYEDALADVRKRLADYKKDHPGEAFGYELGGAALPAVLASLFTGGSAGAATAARFFPTLAKVAATGAGEGAAYAFLTGEGKEDRLNRIPGGAVLGLAGAGAGYVGGKAAMGGAAKMIDYARRKFGPRVAPIVEKELRAAMKAAGIDSIDDAADMIARGEILSDNATLKSVARGYRAASREADDVFQGVYGKTANPPRQDALRRETMEYLQGGMTSGTDANVLRQFTADEAASRAARSAEYNNAFANVPDVGDEVTAEIAGAVRRVPSAQRDLDKLYRAKTGEAPFFTFGDDGAVSFSRNPSLKEAEIVRRGIRDSASREYSAGAGAVGGAIKEVDEGLKGLLDKTSPELAAVRAKWAGIEQAREAFEEGRKAMARGADQVALDFDKWSRSDGTLKAYRAGVMDAYRRKAGTGSKASMPGLIADAERKEGAILQTVFPGDQLDELLGKAGRADAAQKAANEILGGSQTQITAGRMAEQGGPSVIEAGLDVATGGIGAALQLARQAIRSISPKLSPKQAAEAARLMVETNPEVFRRAMSDRRAIDQVTALGMQVVKNLGDKGYVSGGAMAYPAAQGLLTPN